MKRSVFVLSLTLASPAAHAATLDTLDLSLRFDGAGFSNVTIYDSNFDVVDQFAFLDQADDVFGIPQPLPEVPVGDDVSLNAMQDDPFDALPLCSLAGVSCKGAFGDFEMDTFSIGDGFGQTAFGDFNLSGGTQVGDVVTLSVFDGGLTFDDLPGGGFSSWDTFDRRFTVMADNLTAIPLPASLLLLGFGVGAFGLVGRKRKVSA